MINVATARANCFGKYERKIRINWINYYEWFEFICTISYCHQRVDSRVCKFETNQMAYPTTSSRANC